jgi:hypothetical protein
MQLGQHNGLKTGRTRHGERYAVMAFRVVDGIEHTIDPASLVTAAEGVGVRRSADEVHEGWAVERKGEWIVYPEDQRPVAGKRVLYVVGEA